MATKTRDMNPIANAYEGGDVVRLTTGMTAKARGGGTISVKKGNIFSQIKELGTNAGLINS